MENYSYSSYADSHDSSPRSRDNESWDDQQPRTPPPPHASNYKVKFMCSYGGKIQPRPHDNQLTYVGGETKILSVDRNVKFSTIISKLSSFVSDLSNDTCFKYQLPGEDLDALISVTNDEDLDHMMTEYDRLYRSAGSRPARLRIFLFPVSSSNPGSNQSSLSFSGEGDSAKPTQQWFVDALNSVPVHSLEQKTNVSSADFLFGFEQQHQQQHHQHHHQVSTPTKSTIPKSDFEVKNPIESDSDRSTGGDSIHEMQRQIHELQKLQISNQEQQQAQTAAMFQRKNEANLNLSRQYHSSEYQTQVNPYWQQDQQQQQIAERQQQQQQVYMIPSQPPPTAMFQTSAAGVRQVTGQMSHPGQGYYGMQRVVPEVYREQPVYTMGPPQAQQQPQPQPKMMMGEVGGYTTQVAYDSNGRQQLFYTTNANAAVPSSYPTAVATATADPRQSGPLSQEGKPVKLQQA